MKRAHRKAATPGHRVCNRCEKELPATPEVFLRDASRPLGLAYECRPCHSNRRRGKDQRKFRWSELTPEQKDAKKARARRYVSEGYGRALMARKRYERTDACDLTTLEVQAIIEQPCIYCLTTDEGRGLDRIDNSKPHIKGNVLPCCRDCNMARGDRLTVEEMKRVGAVIAQVRAERISR